MRELKFRFWDPKDKAMIYDVTMFTEDSKKVGVLYAWDDRPVMQYTGLKDKNGKAIYEGDICKANEYWQRGVVTWMDYRACFSLIQGNGVIGINDNDGFCSEELEVIGNIYEK